jgi:predicted transcriptional regulator
MAALSLRLDPELDLRLTQEVQRRKTTKTKFVQDLLRQALEPRDPVDLLYAVRAQYGLPEPQSGEAPPTERSRQVKSLVRKKVRAKHAADAAQPGTHRP